MVLPKLLIAPDYTDDYYNAVIHFPNSNNVGCFEIQIVGWYIDAKAMSLV